MSDEPVVLWLTEYQTEVTDRLTAEQAQHLRGNYGSFLTVGRSWEDSASYELTARNYVGTISADGLRIHIQPKTPLTNLFYMLTYAHELAEFRQTEAPLSVGDDLFDFLVDIFVKKVDHLIRQGIYRAYVDSEEQRRTLRGRLMLTKQLQTRTVPITTFHQRINEFTPDLRENRILKFTLWQLSRFGVESADLRRRLRRTLSAFSEVSLSNVDPAECDLVVYTRLNDAYQTPIHLARLFLQHLSLEGNVGETPFKTYLLPMHDIFERFVARYLAEHFAADIGYDVEVQPQIYLDSAQREKGIPDVVLHKEGRPHLILDTKYKLFTGSPSASDRNQMFIYCHTMEVQQAVLIYTNAEAVSYERQFKDMKLKARSLALDGDLATFQRRCRAFAESFAAEVSAIGNPN